MKENQTQNDPQKEVEVAYEKPVIEVIEMEMEGSILQTSGGPGDTIPGW